LKFSKACWAQQIADRRSIMHSQHEVESASQMSQHSQRASTCCIEGSGALSMDIRSSQEGTYLAHHELDSIVTVFNIIKRGASVAKGRRRRMQEGEEQEGRKADLDDLSIQGSLQILPVQP